MVEKEKGFPGKDASFEEIKEWADSLPPVSPEDTERIDRIFQQMLERVNEVSQPDIHDTH